jgi:hypothetical protein
MEEKAVWILTMAILIKRKMMIMIINTKLNQEYLYQSKIRNLKIKKIIICINSLFYKQLIKILLR